MKTAGKIAYAFLFAVVLPFALAAWAVRLDQLVHLSVIGTPVVGIALASAGAMLLIAGIVALRMYGNGWPMSPYPPERRVTAGAYAIVAHPLYTGSVIITAGVAIAFRSAAGLWIVTPAVALVCTAFVIGYEHEATVARFGTSFSRATLRLPAASDDAANRADRISIYVLVLLPWFLAFEAVNALGIPHGARNGWSSLDAAVPVIPWTELVYILDYAFVLAVPLVVRTQRGLRTFAIDGWIATAGATLMYLALPTVIAPRPVPSGSIFAPLLMWERAFDAPLTAFPAFHVIWAAIAAAACSRAMPRLRAIWWILAVAISVSCVTTGMHAMIDIVAAACFASLILTRRRVVRALLHGSELVANSWREWDLGFIRLMSHGLYAAAGGFLGIIIVSMLTGATAEAFAVGLGIIVGAGLWAQFIEGSPQLLRPFGYFGGVIGCSIAIVFTNDPWLMFAAFGVAAPVIQLCGRMRCLVQGCCHGRPATEEIGIHYRHPRSRVTRLSAIAMEPLHATQLYSIATNVVLFVLLLRLWTAHAPLQFIAGAYFILAGAARFVEEHFRGEPQTRCFGGLHSYQWLAIASVIAGAILTTLGNRPAPQMSGFHATAIVAATVFAVLTYFAYGVDFPRLNVRFARLV